MEPPRSGGRAKDHGFGWPFNGSPNHFPTGKNTGPLDAASRRFQPRRGPWKPQPSLKNLAS
jgi:hypothetical protein